MSDKYILVVDDEPDMVWVIQRSLTRAGYKVLTASDGLEALSVARRHHPSLIILDINMPVMNGLDVCAQIRKDALLAFTPIIFLSVSCTLTDRVRGLDQGADEYMTKPFELSELEAHIRALLRRDKPFNPEGKEESYRPSSITEGEICLDLLSHFVKVRDQEFELTPTEFDLLYFLITHPKEVFTSRQILQIIWNYPDEIANTGLVRWHIKNLRNKIELDPLEPKCIVTIARQGYMFTFQNSYFPNDSQTPELVIVS